MPNGGLEPDATTQGKAEHVGPFESEVRDQGGDIVGHQLEAEWALDVGGVAMSLQLNSDHTPLRGKLWHKLAHPLDGGEGSRKHHQRLPAPVDLVIKVQTVDRGIAARRLLVGSYGNPPSKNVTRRVSRFNASMEVRRAVRR